MAIISRHPFPVVAHFDRVAAVSFAFPHELLRPLVEPALELDTFQGLGFVTVAMVWTRRLRPAGFPAFLGQDFFLSGYRIFTRLREESGRRLRGLKILRSETDRRRMVWSGNLLTEYRYRHVQVKVEHTADAIHVRTTRPGGALALDLSFTAAAEGAPPPAGSPFPDWHSARQFAGPMPFTFSPQADGRVVVVQGTRESWQPRPVAVQTWQVALFDEPPFRGTAPILANAFAVENIDYRWERGRLVKPSPAP